MAKRPQGRPVTVDLEPKKLKAFMRLKPTLEDCAAFFECDTSTIEKNIKNQFGVSFGTFREQHMVETRYSIIRTAIQKAKKGDNVMLIFCLKNLCGWKDKHEISTEDGKPFSLAYNPNAPKQ